MSINSIPEQIGNVKEKTPALVDTQVNEPAREEPSLDGISIFEPRDRSLRQELDESRLLQRQLAQTNARPSNVI